LEKLGRWHRVNNKKRETPHWRRAPAESDERVSEAANERTTSEREQEGGNGAGAGALVSCIVKMN